MDEVSKKRVEQAEHHARSVQAELDAIRSSRAYRLAKKAGSIKNQIKANPAALTKKLLLTAVRQPGKLLHLNRTVERGVYMAQAANEHAARYQEWILLHEPDEGELNVQRERSLGFAQQPLISIITPVFNPPVKVLEELIESVLEQTYPNFELCLGNFGNDEAVIELLDHYAAIDSRIKHYPFKENKGIAGNSNLILEKAQGEYMALLDHDDTLSPDALFENVVMINHAPYDFIYSDKDKIDEVGNRFDPLFKADVSPEMLLNVNYLTHLNVMRTSAVRQIGGWDPETDGAQDWDLFLRVIAAVKLIGYIPKVLYHWRVIATSTALSIETKPYALAGQRRAVDKYMEITGIPAKSYHKATELFLRWDPSVLDPMPLVLIHFSNVAHTLRAVSSVRKERGKARIVVLVEESQMSPEIATALKRQADVTVSGYELLAYAATLAKFCTGTGTALFLTDTIRLPRTAGWYENVAGWLAIKEVAAASGRLIDEHDLIVSDGGIISEGGEYLPLFQRFPRYFQSYLGNAEWVRNLTMVSPHFFATDLAELDQYLRIRATPLTRQQTVDDYFLWLSLERKLRLVMSPHATAWVHVQGQTDERRSLLALPNGKKLGLPYYDAFGNPNLSKNDPMRLFDSELFLHESSQANLPAIDQYQYDAMILAGSFDITKRQMATNKSGQAQGALIRPASAAWILPAFSGIYAGLVCIFSFAEYLATKHGIATTFYILKAAPDASEEHAQVAAMFPTLKSAKFVAMTPVQDDRIAAHDLGFATQWATTYPLAKAKQVKRKCYFIQDNEANFYPKGSISALVELGYRFGFYAVAGTEGLLDMYEREYAGKGVVLKSKVDLSVYHPRNDLHYVPKKPYKVFFYARPNMPRNAFELGVAGLKLLKQSLGDDVEVITAGAEWSASSYGVQGMFTNLGKIAYEAVPKLYRSVDAGLMFMFSGHPGVTASELMASGCPVVVNEYDDRSWHELYQHEKTCLITLASASEVSRNVMRCLTDIELRHTLIGEGIKKAETYYSGYEESLETAYRSLCGDL